MPEIRFSEHAEKLDQRNVDLMELIHQFPEPVIPYLVSRVQFIQFNTECHGGCDFCGLPVIRKGNQGFSKESWEQFCEQYLPLLPRTISPYWASDPAFIGSHMRGTTDGFDLRDVVATFEKYRRSDQCMYVSTVLPPNSERALAETARMFDECFRNGTASYLSPIRISQVPKSDTRYPRQKERIDRFVAHMKELGVSEYYINRCVKIQTHNDESLRRIGPWVGMDDRNVATSRDVEPIACTNGVIIKPTGLYAVGNHAVWSGSPYGYDESKLEPDADEFRLPNFLPDFSYRDFDGDLKNIRIYPEKSFTNYDRKGRATKIDVEHDLARDTLTYIFAQRLLRFLEERATNGKADVIKEYHSELLQYVGDVRDRHTNNQYLREHTHPEVLSLHDSYFQGYQESLQSLIRALSQKSS